jgi:hypothetical protein
MGYWMMSPVKILPVLIPLTLSLLGVSLSGVKGQEEQPIESEGVHPGPKEYVRDVFIPHMWQGTKASFANKESIIALGISAATAAAVYTQDNKIDDYWDAEEPLGDSSVIGDVWGEGYIQAAACLGMYGWAWKKNDQEMATTAEVMTEAMLIQSLVINGLKPIVGRERPEGQDYKSFPSGHTGAAFCMAAVLDHRMGHKWGIPLYALALFTGLSRMEDRMHYASDVVMGAAIATIVGYQTSRYHDDYPYKKIWHQENKKNIIMLPYSPEDNAYGIMFTMSVD